MPAKEQTGKPGRVSKAGFRSRIGQFTWDNFTCTQSTGAVAVMLSKTPYQFHGLQTVGVVIFILNLALIALFSSAMVARFVTHPRALKPSLTRPPECFFVASFLLTGATVIMCTQCFGVPRAGPWLVAAVRALFWLYAAASLAFVVAVYAMLFTPRRTVRLAAAPPPVFLTVYNAMLTGTVAATVAGTQPPGHRLAIVAAGVAYQGLGWVLSLLLLSWYLAGMLERGPGTRNQRPALFLTVGSSGYTIVCLIGCARDLPSGYGYFERHPMGVEILQVVADWVGVFLWLLTFWLFAVALVINVAAAIPIMEGRRFIRAGMAFTVPWWSFVFPNVGFTIATGFIGEQFQSNAIKWVATIMTVLVFAFWFMDLVLYFKAILTGQIMVPVKPEENNRNHDIGA
ncbi:voltage-dependent anion channel [Xylariaceae sp. FL0016]|nr:voltage-dependent anion channel [Xylariaceae sp. FL0016]